MRRPFYLLSTAALMAMVGATACGTSSSTPTTGTGGGGLASCQGSITVASDLPTSGGDAAIGGGTEQGVPSGRHASAAA